MLGSDLVMVKVLRKVSRLSSLRAPQAIVLNYRFMRVILFSDHQGRLCMGEKLVAHRYDFVVQTLKFWRNDFITELSDRKPDHHSLADAAGRFRTTRWSVVLLSAQIAAEGRLGP